MNNSLSLEDVCELIVDCKNRTPPPSESGNSFGWAVGTPNITGGVINIESCRRVSRQTFAIWTARAVPQEDDLIITREAPVGRVGRVPAGVNICLGQRTMLLRPDRTVVDPRFLHYLLMGPRFQHSMHSFGAGTTVPHLKVGEVRRLPLPPLPTLSVQRAIGEILGALDDKIAVNERITVALLALADAYFEAELSGVDSRTETFGSVASVFGGGTPSTSEPDLWDGDIAWTTPTDVTALRAPYLFETSREITDAGLRECASRLYPVGSIFMTSRATIGAFAVPQIPAAVNQGFIVVVPPSGDLRWWLFHEMRSRVDEMIGLANGSTFLELSRKNFKAMPVRLPTPERLASFAARVDPLHRRAAKTVEESQVLAHLRDTLLPRLMSGEIRVRDAEWAVEEAT